MAFSKWVCSVMCKCIKVVRGDIYNQEERMGEKAVQLSWDLTKCCSKLKLYCPEKRAKH